MPVLCGATISWVTAWVCLAQLYPGFGTGVMDGQTEVRRWVNGIGELQFVAIRAVAIIQDDGEVEMNADGLEGVATVVAGVTQECALADKNLVGVRGNQPQ